MQRCAIAMAVTQIDRRLDVQRLSRDR